MARMITADPGPATAEPIGADAEPGDLYGPPDDDGWTDWLFSLTDSEA